MADFRGLLSRLLAEPQHLLATLVLGNTVANGSVAGDHAVGGAVGSLAAVRHVCRRCCS